MLESRTVITFGLTEEENAWVRNHLPARDYTLLDTEEATDLIALNCSMSIINAAALEEADVQLLFAYYSELDGCFSETVFWLGSPLPPAGPQKKFRCAESFAALGENLKYAMLEAHRKNRKTVQFSTSLFCGLRILTTIRSFPGITTKQLAQRCEISVRSVLRYIETLRCCGEGIEYNGEKKGWQLFHGISFLLGEHMQEEWDR